MFEKVNPSHPDKLCDRIAGALVDLAYAQKEEPHIAVEVLLGHGICHIIAETDVHLLYQDVFRAVQRIAGTVELDYVEVKQDGLLAKNQEDGICCGDNGIFRGMPITEEQRKLTHIARSIYERFPHDGKYLIDADELIICQSNVPTEYLEMEYQEAAVNPLGDWTGGPNVDTGATNRKLGSDMGDAVTGGGIHGKDFSKADVSVNIYAHIKAQMTRQPVEICCAIGDIFVDCRSYAEIVEIARGYIKSIGGFEKFAEWGFI